MKLRYLKTSPFVRKVLVAAHELGLADRIELVPTDPWAADTDLGATNPLLKVPALERDDGPVLIERALIVEHLDALAGGGQVYPADPAERRNVAQGVALIDGATDAAVLRVVEGRMRPEDKRWDGWDLRQAKKVRAALDMLEAVSPERAPADAPAPAAAIALGCFLAYLDFRFAFEDWRPEQPRLAAWYAGFAKRPSMAATRPDG